MNYIFLGDIKRRVLKNNPQSISVIKDTSISVIDGIEPQSCQKSLKMGTKDWTSVEF